MASGISNDSSRFDEELHTFIGFTLAHGRGEAQGSGIIVGTQIAALVDGIGTVQTFAFGVYKIEWTLPSKFLASISRILHFP